MIQLQTTTDITLNQAIFFETKQNIKGISKSGMHSVEDCKWLLKVERPQFENGFKADISWHQLQVYKPSSESEDTAIRESQMYSEVFYLTKEQMNGLFIEVGMSIIPSVDDPHDKWMEITRLGVKHWLENLNKVFGEGVEFEIL